MNGRTCAYCGSDGPLTREHLWPASLHRRVKEANLDSGSLFWLRRIEREIEGEPTLRDVCQICNNGVLSSLDAYICELFDNYFIHIVQRFERVAFKFEYHLLKRWLLKMCYNSARMHGSMDLVAYPDLLPYIHGRSLTAGRSVQLYLQLSYPGSIPRNHLIDPSLADAPQIWEPQLNRCGHIWFNVRGVGQKVLRAVHLRSYSFFLAFFEPGEKSLTSKHFANVFLKRMPATQLLLPSRQQIEIVCDGIDAWESFYASRENKFIARDDSQ